MSELDTDLIELRRQENDVTAAVNSLLDSARVCLIGRDAIIGRGKYQGRLGVVESVIYCGNRGKLLALCRPYKLRGEGFLNDHPDARSYWPLETLKVEER